MRGYRTAICLFLLWVFNASAVPIQNGGQKKCASYCSGTKKLGYVIGKAYEYDYKITSATTLEGTTKGKSEMVVNALVTLNIIDQCEGELKVNTISLDDINVEGIDEWANKLTAYPLRFGFNDGEVSDVCPEESDLPLAINFKKGILSQLQNTMTSLSQTTRTKDIDINGACPVTYSVNDDGSITKVKDVMQCDQPIELHTFMRSNHYESDSEIKHLPLMKGTQTCKRTIESIIKESVCEEEYKFRPFSTESAGAMTSIKAELKFLEEGSFSAQNNVIVSRETLRATVAHDERNHFMTGAMGKARNLMTELCNNVGGAVKKTTPKLFMLLTDVMKHMTREELDNFQRISQTECNENSQRFFNDALLMTKTGPAFELMHEEITAGNVADLRVTAWLSTLSFLEHPHLDMIQAVMPLMDDEQNYIQASMSLGSLVFSYCQHHSNCADESVIQEFVNKIDARIANCQLEYPEDNRRMREILVALRAVGNAGIEVPSLAVCIHDSDVLMEIRVTAMQAYRNMPCQSKTDKVFSMIKNNDVNAELRIAGYNMVTKCPCSMCIDHITETLNTVKSDQVFSYVVSHLRSMISSENPSHKAAKKILSEIEIPERKEKDFPKFSKFMDMGGYTESYNYGHDLEASVVFSPDSLLPRSGSLNLTIQLFGRSINLFEFGANANGFDKTILNLFKNQLFSEAIENIKETDADPFSEFLEGNPRATYYMRMFGQEVAFNDWYIEKADEEISDFNIIKLMKDFSNEQEIDLRRNMIIDSGHFHVSSITGFPVSLTLKGAANLRLAASGKLDISKIKAYSLNIEGSLAPSAAVEINAEMTFDVGVAKSGLVVSTNIFTSTAGGMKLKLTKGKAFEFDINMPDEKQEIVSVNTDFFLYKSGEKEKAEVYQNFKEHKSCSPSSVVESLGTSLCTDIKYSESTPSSPWIPFNGPFSADIYLEKTDKFDSYSIEGTIAKAKKPNKPSNVKVFFDTKGSSVNRKMKVILKIVEQSAKVTLDIVGPNVDLQFTMDGELLDDERVYSLSYMKKKYAVVKHFIKLDKREKKIDFTIDFPQFRLKSPIRFMHHHILSDEGITTDNLVQAHGVEMELGAKYEVLDYNLNFKHNLKDRNKKREGIFLFKHAKKGQKTNTDFVMSYGFENEDPIFIISHNQVMTGSWKKNFNVVQKQIFKFPNNYVQTATNTYKRDGDKLDLQLDSVSNGENTKIGITMEMDSDDPFQATLECKFDIFGFDKISFTGEIKPKEDDVFHYEWDLKANPGTPDEASLTGSLKITQPYVFEVYVTLDDSNTKSLYFELNTNPNDFKLAITVGLIETYHGELTFQYQTEGTATKLDGKLEYGMNKDKWNLELKANADKNTFDILVKSDYAWIVKIDSKISYSRKNPSLEISADWNNPEDKDSQNAIETYFSFENDGQSLWSAKRNLKGDVKVKSSGFYDTDFKMNFDYERTDEKIDANGLVSWSEEEQITVVLKIDSESPSDKSIVVTVTTPFAIQTVNVKLIYKMTEQMLETTLEVIFDDNRVGVTLKGELIDTQEKILFKSNLQVETSYVNYETLGMALLIDCESQDQHSRLHFIKSDFDVFWGQTKNEKVHFDIEFEQKGHWTESYNAKRSINVHIPLEELTDVSISWNVDYVPQEKIDFDFQFNAENKDIILFDSKGKLEMSNDPNDFNLKTELKMELEKDLTSLETLDIEMSVKSKNTNKGQDSEASFVMTWNTNSQINFNSELSFENSGNNHLSFNLVTPFDSFKLMKLTIDVSGSSATIKGKAVFDGNDQLVIDGSLAYALPSISGTLQVNTPFKGYKKVKVIPDINFESGNMFGTITVELAAKKTVEVYAKYASIGKTEMALRVKTPTNKELNLELTIKGKADNYVLDMKLQDITITITSEKADAYNVKWSVVGERNKKKVIFKGERSKVSVDGEDQYGAMISFKHPSTKLDISLESSLALATDGSKISTSVLMKYVTNSKKKLFKSFRMNMDIYPQLNEIRYTSQMPFGEASLTGRYQIVNGEYEVLLSGDALDTPVAFKIRASEADLSGVFEYGAQTVGARFGFLSPYDYEENIYFHRNGKEIASCIYKNLMLTNHIMETSLQCHDSFWSILGEEFSRLYNARKTLMAPHFKKLGMEMKKKRAMYIKFAKLTYNSPPMAIVKMIGDKTAAYRKKMMATIQKKIKQGKTAVATALNTISGMKLPFKSQSEFLDFLRNQVEINRAKIIAFVEETKTKIQGLLDSSSETSVARYLAQAISDGEENNLIIAIRNRWKEAEQEIKIYFQKLGEDMDYIIENAQNKYIADRLNNLKSYIKYVSEEFEIERYVKIPVLSFMQDLINQGDESTRTVDKFHNMLKDYLKLEEQLRVTEWDKLNGKYAFEIYFPEPITDFYTMFEDADNFIEEKFGPIRRQLDEISRNFESLKEKMDAEIDTVDIYDRLSYPMRYPAGVGKIFENRLVTFDGAEKDIDGLCMFTLIQVKEPHVDEEFGLTMSSNFHLALQSGPDNIAMLRRVSGDGDDWAYQLQVNGKPARFGSTEFADYSNNAYHMYTPNKNLKVSCYKDHCNVILISWYYNNVEGALGNFNKEAYDDMTQDWEVGCS